jgi:hypothetical protein
MNFIFQFAMFIGGIAAYMGAAAYMFEVSNENVSMSTKWSDLDGYQWVAVSMAIGGALVFIASLILGVATKGI